MGSINDTEGKAFGEKLFILRKGKGMTQEALADLLQVSRQSVSKWESGVAFPETEKIIALTKIFDVSLDFLLADKENVLTESKDKIKTIQTVNTIALIVLGVLPLLITAMFLAFFPPLIPAHYNLAGDITRWGSKYENLIFPLTNFFFAAFLYFFQRFIKKHFKEKQFIALQIFLNAMLLVMFVMIVYLLVKGYLIAVDSEQDFTVNKFQILLIAFGVFFLIVGAIMPFVPKNTVFGLRTNLSMRNDELWKMSQTVAGISIALLGLILIILNTFYSNGFFNAIISLPLTIVFIVIAIVTPYIIARKRQGTEK